MIKSPFETVSDSFYFVQGKMVMHNKAAYSYAPFEWSRSIYFNSYDRYKKQGRFDLQGVGKSSFGGRLWSARRRQLRTLSGHQQTLLLPNLPPSKCISGECHLGWGQISPDKRPLDLSLWLRCIEHWGDQRTIKFVCWKRSQVCSHLWIGQLKQKSINAEHRYRFRQRLSIWVC